MEDHETEKEAFESHHSCLGVVKLLIVKGVWEWLVDRPRTNMRPGDYEINMSAVVYRIVFSFLFCVVIMSCFALVANLLVVKEWAMEIHLLESSSARRDFPRRTPCCLRPGPFSFVL